jgi:proton-translocating NADH-quinone oxidoreductase chain N
LVTGNVWVALPVACLAGGAFAVYLVARLLTDRNDLLASFTALVFATAVGTLVPLDAIARAAFQGPGSWDQVGSSGVEVPLPAWGYLGAGGAFLCAEPGALAVAGVALGLGTLVALYSGRYLALDRRYETYYPLLLLLATGLVGMVLAADLFNLYLFCELMSVAAYALVAFRRRTDTAIEAGFKYLIMGSVGTAAMLMGLSFVYREMGQLTPPSLAAQAGAREVLLVGVPARAVTGAWARVGLACFLVGLGVKSAIVPLHTWLPDAHGRAPSSVSAMLSGIVIQSAFYTLLKVGLGWGLPARGLGTLLIVLALFNMTLGNGMALVQTNTKRLLAYSSIAQMGYVMLSIGIGLRYGIPGSIQAGFFLLLAHAAMKGLAFLSKGVCHFYCDTTTVAELRGTATQLPLVAVTFSVALGGLAGVPPLAGFAGKWFILTRILSAADLLIYVGLAAFVLNGLLSLGYYLPLIGALFAPPLATARTGGGRGRIAISPWMAVPLAILGGLVLAIGFYPVPWLDWVAGAGVYLSALGR